MKQLIRIEYSNGIGVFRAIANGDCVIDSHTQSETILDRHSDFNKFPSLRMDGRLYQDSVKLNMEDYLFAFNSLEMFNIAFTSEEVKEFINDLNFKVYSIIASDTYTSQYQSIYHKDSIIQKTDISYMFL